MSISTLQQIVISKYIFEQKVKNIKYYPLVLMLEPHFKTNLNCIVSGKNDYPDAVLNEYLSSMKCEYIVKECDAPVVAITGGEPLLHDDMPEIVEFLIKKKKFVYVSTNALLLPKNIYDYEPSQYLTWSIHLNGLKEDHDKLAGQDGVFDNAIHSIKLAKTKGFRVTIDCSIYNHQRLKSTIEFLNYISKDLKIDGINITPGYSYERAKDQENFLSRENTKKIFRNLFKDKNFKKWNFNQSNLYLDFLAGNQTYLCKPWSSPTYNIFGWQKPCYHLSEGYYKTFDELINKTDWKQYGTGNYDKCSDCMTHCGYESTAIEALYKNPWEGLKKKIFGIRTTGPMVEDIKLSASRPAEDLYDKILEQKMYELDLM